MDDIPIPSRPAFNSPYPSDEEVLKRFETRIREKQREASCTRQPATANTQPIAATSQLDVSHVSPSA
jgi:hypothetical protein